MLNSVAGVASEQVLSLAWLKRRSQAKPGIQGSSLVEVCVTLYLILLDYEKHVQSKKLLHNAINFPAT